MHVVLIRTRLQALVAREIMSQFYENDRWLAVFTYQIGTDEDAPEVYEVYREIREKSTASLRVVAGRGLIRTTVKFMMLLCLAAFTRGKVFLAGIDSYPFSLAAKCIWFASVCTFDDGSANILSCSRMFREAPLLGDGFKARVARAAFPKGCCHWLRQRTDTHYTIFPGFENIVSEDRLVNMDWSWQRFFYASDFNVVPQSVQRIILGIPRRGEAEYKVSNALLASYLPYVDLYIMHPRERDWDSSEKCVRLKSPAEAVLERLAERRPLTVFHFGSTVSLSLRGNASITFVDIRTDGGRLIGVTS